VLAFRAAFDETANRQQRYCGFIENPRRRRGPRRSQSRRPDSNRGPLHYELRAEPGQGRSGVDESGISTCPRAFLGHGRAGKPAHDLPTPLNENGPTRGRSYRSMRLGDQAPRCCTLSASYTSPYRHACRAERLARFDPRPALRKRPGSRPRVSVGRGRVWLAAAVVRLHDPLAGTG
jgi:hypothetical protein